MRGSKCGGLGNTWPSLADGRDGGFQLILGRDKADWRCSDFRHWIVSRGRSTALIERLKHAETEAIRQIPKTVDQPRYEIYTTLEPCPYCTGAIRMD